MAATLVKFAILPPMINTFPAGDQQQHVGSSLPIYRQATFFSDTQMLLLKDQTVMSESNSLNTRLTFGMLLSRHQRENGFSVVVGLLFTGRTGVFAIVCQFIHSAQVAYGVAAEEKTVKTRTRSENKINVNEPNKHL